MNASKTINGIEFYNALISGISNVISHHEYLNKINVFPVPDGDTGTNLLFTLKPITQIDKDKVKPHLGETLKLISDLAIDSARGNSGTIMAQYLVGMAESSSEISELSSDSISQIFNSGYDAAFLSMSEPVDGTVISVMRDAAEASNDTNSNEMDVLSKLKDIYKVSLNSLNKTPEQMKLLKDSGVVDAGAQGFVDLLEGIIYFIENKKIMNDDIIRDISSEELMPDINLENYSESNFQYCTECIINSENLSRKEIKEKLAEFGDSFIIAGTKSKVKIHIHTNEPNSVFQVCESYGEVVNKKADDMFKQIDSAHNKKSSIAIVTDSGCDIAIDPHESNIHVVPVRYSFGQKDYIDKVSHTSEEFYNELQTNPIHPKTSQPAIGDFVNKFKYLSSHYESVISIHIPEKLSGTMQSCKNAISKIGDFKITAIDSLSASVGLGLIVKSAGELAEVHKDHDVLIDKINKLIGNTKIFLGIRDLNYAIKGGRVSKYKGAVAKFLNIRPILTTDSEGKLKTASAFFGEKNLHKKMGDFVISNLNDKKFYRFSIAHSNAEDEGSELLDHIQNNYKNITSIDLVDMGSALGVHAGPGAFGVGCQEVEDD